MAKSKRQLDADTSTTRVTKKLKKVTVSEPKESPHTKPTESPAQTEPEQDRAFPRGGGSVLTPLEHKQIKRQAEEDVLFEQSGRSRREADEDDFLDPEDAPASAERPSKRKRANVKQKHSKGHDQPQFRSEGLNYKNVMVGALVLGQIAKVTARDIALTLPNNLTGYIPITAISDQLNQKIESAMKEDAEDSDDSSEPSEDIHLPQLFQRGQYLRAAVTSSGETGGKRRIELTINPSKTNGSLSRKDITKNCLLQASIRSVEDRGVLVDLGLQGNKSEGFVSARDLGKGRKLEDMQEGMVLLCQVLEESGSSKVYQLSADPERMGNVSKSALSKAPNIDPFLPGVLTEILVSEANALGFKGEIMGLLDVTADFFHSGASRDQDKDGSKVEPGSKIKARVIFNFDDLDSRKVFVSVLPNILSLKDFEDSSHPLDMLPSSTIVEEAKVCQVIPRIGLLVDVGVPGTLCFVHISKLSDDRVDHLLPTSGPYAADSIHRTRITGFNAIDDVLLGSMQQSVLEKPFLSLEDIIVGSKLQGTFTKLVIKEEGVEGAVITLTEGITALAPALHLSDIVLTQPEKKYRPGMSVTGRVLSVDPDRRVVQFTLKKSLVNSELKVWKDFQNIDVDDTTVGTVLKVKPAGAIVQFYGKVRGFLPKSEVSDLPIQDLAEHLHPGKIVQVRAIKVDPEHARLTVSCRDAVKMDADMMASFSRLKLSALVSGRVTSRSASMIVLETETTKFTAYLPIAHLTDGLSADNEAASKKIKDGRKLKDLLIVKKADATGSLTVSLKPSLKEAVEKGQFITKYSQVHKGQRINGFVRNITANALFIEFGGGVVGYLSKYSLPTDVRAQDNFGMVKDQSVTAIVLSVDAPDERLQLTLKEDHEIIDRLANEQSNAKIGGGPPKTPEERQAILERFKIGSVIPVHIVNVKDTQLNVKLADNVFGRIDISQAFDDWKSIGDKKKPLSKFQKGDEIRAKIMGLHDARTRHFLPFSHRQGTMSMFELSCKPQDVKEPDSVAELALNDLTVDSEHIAYVNNFAQNGLWVNITPKIRGRIRTLDLAYSTDNIEEEYPIGCALKVRVKSIDVASSHLDLIPSGAAKKALDINDLQIGTVLAGRVTKATEAALFVDMGDGLLGTIGLTELSDDFDQADPTLFNKNDMVKVCIVDKEVKVKKIHLSLRPSKILSSSLAVRDPSIVNIEEAKAGRVVRGFVKNITDIGVFISLGPTLTGFARVTDLFDEYVKDWKPRFDKNQVVSGRILRAEATGQVQMGLKKSMLEAGYKPPLRMQDLEVGDIFTGKIRKVEDFGVFIVIDNSNNVSGLCHRSEIADRKIDNVKGLFSVGDPVKIKVLKVDLEKNRLSFGLKGSYFEKGDAEDMEDVQNVSGEDSPVKTNGAAVENGDTRVVHEDEDDKDDSSASSDDDVEMEDAELLGLTASTSSTSKGLQVGGFDWLGNGLKPNSNGDAKASGDSRNKTTTQTKEKKQLELMDDRTDDILKYGPQTASDYERQLLSQPDSSQLWIEYMSFQLQLSELEKARQIAERALKTINIREDAERTNIWIALLNLEAEYGDDDTTEAAFKRACQHCDPAVIHEKFAKILIDSGKHDKADTTFQAMLKSKDTASRPDAWLNYATFLFTTLSDVSRGRALLPRAMQSVPTHLHRQLTTRFGALEFTSPNGEVERGRTIFEGLVSTWPRHWDLWDQYVDLEISKGDQRNVRPLFERMAGQKMKPRRAKYLFKRWLKWEEENGGDASAVDTVKARAVEYARLTREKAEEEA